VLTGGTGTISFASGNTFTLTAGDITFTPDEESQADLSAPDAECDGIDFGNGGLNFYATDTEAERHSIPTLVFSTATIPASIRSLAVGPVTA